MSRPVKMVTPCTPKAGPRSPAQNPSTSATTNLSFCLPGCPSQMLPARFRSPLVQALGRSQCTSLFPETSSRGDLERPRRSTSQPSFSGRQPRGSGLKLRCLLHLRHDTKKVSIEFRSTSNPSRRSETELVARGPAALSHLCMLSAIGAAKARKEGTRGAPGHWAAPSLSGWAGDLTASLVPPKQ